VDAILVPSRVYASTFLHSTLRQVHGFVEPVVVTASLVKHELIMKEPVDSLWVRMGQARVPVQLEQRPKWVKVVLRVVSGRIRVNVIRMARPLALQKKKRMQMDLSESPGTGVFG
jgi:hypothetical protein